MSWSEPGFGFFGKGFWARRVLWESVPVKHRYLDVNGYLEKLLGAYGDELEAFLAQISLLPSQRDAYQVRGLVDQEEWFYFTDTIRQDDPYWGNVVRLIGEADGAEFPAVGRVIVTMEAAGYTACVPGDIGRVVEGIKSGDTGTLVSYDNVARIWWVSIDTDDDRFTDVEIVRVVDGTGIGTTAGASYDPVGWFPYEAIADVARWWSAPIAAVDDATGEESTADFEVVRVRTRNYDQAAIYNASRSLGNEVWVKGGDLVLPFQYPNGWVISGNADTDAGAFGSGVPVGVGNGLHTTLLHLPGPKQRLQSNSGKPIAGACVVVDFRVTPYTVPVEYRVYDQTDITLGPEMGRLYPDDGGGGIDNTMPLGIVDYASGTIVIDTTILAGPTLLEADVITAHWKVRGYYLDFRPPRIIDRLARDYGFDSDRNDPEDRQRAAIAHLHQYFGCKGAQDAYRIRGEISLFNVFVRSLWRLCDADLAASLPSDRVFEYGGVFYTDISPRYLRFDDITADEQYYDMFQHENPGPPEWLALTDRALMYEDDGYADGMSVAQAFALDVTQGYECPVSETNINAREQATLESKVALTDAQAAALGLTAGWLARVRMQRCQADAFTFSRGHFGLTVYDRLGAIRPAIGDQVYWIDYEYAAWTMDVPGATPEQDSGLWQVIIGVGLDSGGSPLPIPDLGVDIAVRYLPELDNGDCCFCRSYKVRAEIQPMPQAYAYYGTDAALQAAVKRLEEKILGQLIPIHARVVEWSVTTEFSLEINGAFDGMGSIEIPIPEFSGITDRDLVLATAEQRGDLLVASQRTSLDGDLAPVADTGWQTTGVSDPDTWFPMVGFVDLDITAALVAADPGTIRCTSVGGPPSTYGDMRWTFRVTRNTIV